MNQQEAADLLDRFRANQCKAEEIAIVESWHIHEIDNSPVSGNEPDYAAIEKEIWANIKPRPAVRRIPVYLRYAAAVLTVVGISTLAYYYNHNNKPEHTKTLAENIMPGSNKATLTLANGKVINLTSLQGPVANGSQVLITNNSGNGIVTYKLAGGKAGRTKVHIDNSPEEVNTISTPKGGQYQLILEDGTRVVLNSSSTLQFRTSFAAGERKVLLTGEAYFEVAKDTKRPFLVTTKAQQLKVLGTHFNVSAYPDETLTTTLAEGSVQLTSSSSLQKQTLKPDQQALLLSTGYQVSKVNSGDAIAWKDGDFVFKKTSVSDVLRQLSRWYNVDADLENVPNLTVNGSFSKGRTLAELIKLIEFSNGIKITLTNERRLAIKKN